MRPYCIENDEPVSYKNRKEHKEPHESNFVRLLIILSCFFPQRFTNNPPDTHSFLHFVDAFDISNCL
jgi:hypothetical protein